MIVELVKKSIQLMDQPLTDQLKNNLKNQPQSPVLLVYQVAKKKKHLSSFQKVSSYLNYLTSNDPRFHHPDRGQH